VNGLFAPLLEEEDEIRKLALSGELSFSSDRDGSGSGKSRLLRGEDNPYHVNHMKVSEWDKRSFGAKVTDKGGQAQMKQKSGF